MLRFRYVISYSESDEGERRKSSRYSPHSALYRSRFPSLAPVITRGRSRCVSSVTRERIINRLAIASVASILPMNHFAKFLRGRVGVPRGPPEAISREISDREDLN